MAGSDHGRQLDRSRRSSLNTLTADFLQKKKIYLKNCIKKTIKEVTNFPDGRIRYGSFFYKYIGTIKKKIFGIL